MNAWEKEMEKQITELKQKVNMNMLILEVMVSRIIELIEEIKNFKEYEEMVQDITMEHIIRQDAKRILKKLKSGE